MDSEGNILSNPRKTFITPPGKHNQCIKDHFCTYRLLWSLGTGFMPKETADHHRDNVLEILQKALDEAKLKISDIGKRIGSRDLSSH